MGIRRTKENGVLTKRWPNDKHIEMYRQIDGKFVGVGNAPSFASRYRYTNGDVEMDYIWHTDGVAHREDGPALLSVWWRAGSNIVTFEEKWCLFGKSCAKEYVVEYVRCRDNGTLDHFLGVWEAKNMNNDIGGDDETEGYLKAIVSNPP